MTHETLERPLEDIEEDLPTDGLFRVWFDVNCGYDPVPDWWCEDPEPLPRALDEAAKARAAGWIVMVLPDGQNPRADGRWANPY